MRRRRREGLRSALAQAIHAQTRTSACSEYVTLRALLTPQARFAAPPLLKAHFGTGHPLVNGEHEPPAHPGQGRFHLGQGRSRAVVDGDGQFPKPCDAVGHGSGMWAQFWSH